MKVTTISNIALAGLAFFAMAGNIAFSHGISVIVVLFAAFGATFLGTAYLVASRRRGGLLISVGASLLFFVANLPVAPIFLTEPTVFPRFAYAVAAPPVALLSVVSSLLSWRYARAASAEGRPVTRWISVPRFLAFLILGFVIGGIFIGGIAANTESTLIANSGVSANVTVVLGAGEQGNPLPYSPSPYTVKVGASVTWVNKDSTTHTVTSSGSSLFDSGNMAPGATYSFTFTQPGTYQYYCTIHPWMKGTIVVTSG